MTVSTLAEIYYILIIDGNKTQGHLSMILYLVEIVYMYFIVAPQNTLT